jgi:signal transduction histidine kinase
MLTLAAALVLPLVLFIALASAFTWQAQRRQIESEALERAREVTAQVDAAILYEMSALEVLAEGATITSSDWPAARRLQGVAQRRPRWKNAIITNAASGQEILELARTGAPRPARPAIAAYLASARYRPVAMVSGVEGGPPTCPCLVLHAPVVREGRLAYVLTVELDTADFQAVLLAHHRQGGVSALVDRQGRFLGRSLDHAKWVGQLSTPYVRNAMARSSGGIYRGRTWEGLENYSAFAVSRTTGLSTHIAMGASVLNEPQRRYLGLLIFAGTMALGLAAAIGAFALNQRVARRREEEGRRQSQKLEALGQLAGGIAHDFNNLLAVIIGNLDRLSNAGAEGRDRRAIDNSLAAAARAAKLVQQLLAFARTQAPEISRVDLAAVVDGVRDLIAHAVGAGVSVEVDIAEDARLVSSNAGELELALLNLAVNARDAMPDGGRIRIVARRGAFGLVDLSVEDNGPGMSRQVAARAFEPFYTTKPLGKGTGLGLAQVQKLAEHSGGSVLIRTEEGQGCAIVIRLPAGDSHPEG